MAEFNITFRTKGKDTTITVGPEEYLLEAAERNGLDLPFSCRSGACSTCCAKMVSGSVDQSDQVYLEDEQIEDNYVLLCSAYAQSDCVFETHKEEEV